tara:strand:+ start:162 stop:440 length:279 start_codon:yes stop_codon:yes gene_type:complete
MKKSYNGWTNYATWRINLEILGDIQWVEEEIEILNEEMLKDYVENIVFPYSENTGLIGDYAHAFLYDVNYREILEHILEDYGSEDPTIGYTN